MTNNDVYAIISLANNKQNWVSECPIDQLTKTDVASIIRRATSGQPILGDPNRVFDGSERTDTYNPNSAFGWDLDDVTDAMDNYNASSVDALYQKLQDEIESSSKKSGPVTDAAASDATA